MVCTINLIYILVMFVFSSQGKMSYVNTATLISIKVKRNQFPYLLKGLPNHQFGYVLFGNLLFTLNGSYTFCSRSDDG